MLLRDVDGWTGTEHVVVGAAVVDSSLVVVAGAVVVDNAVVVDIAVVDNVVVAAGDVVVDSSAAGSAVAAVGSAGVGIVVVVGVGVAAAGGDNCWGLVAFANFVDYNCPVGIVVGYCCTRHNYGTSCGDCESGFGGGDGGGEIFFFEGGGGVGVGLFLAGRNGGLYNEQSDSNRYGTITDRLRMRCGAVVVCGLMGVKCKVLGWGKEWLPLVLVVIKGLCGK